MPEDKNNSISLFQSKQVKRIWHNNQWYFSVTDVVAILTDSRNVKEYIKKMRTRDNELSVKWGTICTPLDMTAKDGKKRKLNCANTEGIFRIIQTIPSPKAEPFKLWLAKIGYERIQEIENPELATQRTRAIYKAKGYSNAWIEKRMRGIEVRETLTDEWNKRGVNKGKEYGILTAEISKATFGMTPSQYKKHKNLKRENLRDHMNDLELIFSMLGEAATTEIAHNRDVQGFIQNKEAAQKGGEVAGKARKDVEKKSGKKIVSKKNYLEKNPKYLE